MKKVLDIVSACGYDVDMKWFRQNDQKHSRIRTALLCGLILSLVFGQIRPLSVLASSLTIQEEIDDAEDELDETQDAIDDAQSELEDAKEELESAKEEADAAQEELESAQEEADELQEEYASLSEQLQAVGEEIGETQEAIDAAQEEIEEITAELEDTQAQAEEQYESMKLRIKYMYENSIGSMVVQLLSCESFSEFLNRAEYIYSIVSYDQQKLEEYEETLQEIEEQKAALEATEESLISSQDALEAEQEEMDALVKEAAQSLSEQEAAVAAAESSAGDAASDVSDAQSAQDELSAKIAALEETEDELEAQIADAQLALAKQVAEELAAQKAETGTTEDTSGALTGYTESDLLLLAALIQAEADDQSYQGKLAVGSVVMNRVKSSLFPNTISGVIYQSNQFACVSNGHLALILEQGPNDTCISAAKEVLNGYRNVSYLFFWATWLAEQKNIYSVTTGVIIGDHYFYNYN